MKNKRIITLNILFGLILQIVTIINYFVITHIILSSFGSEVNGLISSLSQFLGYISLFEGGVSGVITANLYRPLVEKDEFRINIIINTATRFFRKIGLFFMLYTLILAFVYPVIKNTGFSYKYVFCLILIISISTLIQYMLAITYKTLLTADKKVYIVSGIQSIALLINIVVAYLSVYFFNSIHSLKIATGLVFIIQPIIYWLYVKSHYNLKITKHYDNSLLEQRWNGFAVNTAAFMHNNTDIVILTFFANYSIVSVYSVYMLVVLGIRQFVIAVSNSIQHSVGQAYAGNDQDRFKNIFSLYQHIILFLVFFIFPVAGMLITPFVMLYTNGLKEHIYYQPAFGYIVLVAEAVYLVRFPHMNLAYAANKFKDIKTPAYIESAINILASLALVKRYNIVGVAIGTLVAMLFRTIYHIWFAEKFANTKQIDFYKKFFSYLLLSTFGLVLCKCLISPVQANWGDWITHALIYCVILLLLLVAGSCALFHKEYKTIFNFLKQEGNYAKNKK